MNLWRDLIAAALCTTLALGVIACGEFTALKGKKSTATNPTTPTGGGTASGNGAVPAAQTKLEIVSKDLNGLLDQIRLTVVREDGVVLVFNGLMDVDNVVSGVVSRDTLTSQGSVTNVAFINRSVLPTGDDTILMSYNNSFEDETIRVLVFSSKAGSDAYTLNWDEKVLPSLGLETAVGTTTQNLREELIVWLREFGVNGLDTFKDAVLEDDID